MPQVPRLNGLQVNQAAMPNIRVSTDAPAAAFGLGPAAQKASESVIGFAEKIKKNADDVAVLDAENKLTEFETKFLYDPENGMARKKGKDAFGVPEQFSQEYEKALSEIEDGLSNDVQRVSFRERANKKRQELDRQVMRHVGAQIDQYDDEVTQASIDLAQNSAINGYQNPEVVYQNIGKQKDEIMKYADRKGMSPEMTRLMIEKAESKTHGGVISRMVDNGDDIGAEAYFKANKDYITDGSVGKMEELVFESSMKGKAQRFADDVMNKGITKQQAMIEASKIENPRIREATESRVAKMFAMKDEAEKEQQENLLEFAVNKFDKEGSIDDPKMVKVIQSMKPETRKALDSYMNANPIRDDGVLYYRLTDIAANPQTRDKFINYDLTKERGNLSKDNWNKLIGLQKDLKNGSTRSKAEAELDGILSDSQVMQDAFVAAGFKVSDKESFAKYRQKIDAEVIKYKQANGKKVINNDELRRITGEQLANEIIGKGIFGGLFGPSKKPRYQIEIDEIPEQDRRNIEEALKANGKPVNDNSIINLFIRKAQANERK